MMTAVMSLVIGVAVGYLAQRSRLCFIGGLRDWLLFRETSLLKGALAFFLTAWIAFPLVALMGGGAYRVPAATGSAPMVLAGLAAGGGLVLGLVSVFSNGCPLRQHVLAAQGHGDAWAYIGGFAAGAVLYQTWLLPMLIGFF